MDPAPMIHQAKLRTSGTTIKFGGQTIVDHLDLQVGSGEMVGILGRSGSGKTTLLRGLACLTPWDAGRLYVGEEELTPHTTSGLGSHGGQIQLVFQAANLFPNMTVARNLTIGLERVRGLSQEAARKRAKESAARLEIDDLMERYPDQISGGEAQRVAILRSMLMNPDVLLLDEITASLDPISAANTMAVVDQLRKEIAPGIAIVMATHAARLADRYCDRMHFLEDGQLSDAIERGQLFHAAGSAVFAEYVQALRDT